MPCRVFMRSHSEFYVADGNRERRAWKAQVQCEICLEQMETHAPRHHLRIHCPAWSDCRNDVVFTFSKEPLQVRWSPRHVLSLLQRNEHSYNCNAHCSLHNNTQGAIQGGTSRWGPRNQFTGFLVCPCAFGNFQDLSCFCFLGGISRIGQSGKMGMCQQCFNICCGCCSSLVSHRCLKTTASPRHSVPGFPRPNVYCICYLLQSGYVGTGVHKWRPTGSTGRWYDRNGFRLLRQTHLGHCILHVPTCRWLFQIHILRDSVRSSGLAFPNWILNSFKSRVHLVGHLPAPIYTLSTARSERKLISVRHFLFYCLRNLTSLRKRARLTEEIFRNRTFFVSSPLTGSETQRSQKVFCKLFCGLCKMINIFQATELGRLSASRSRGTGVRQQRQRRPGDSERPLCFQP